MNEIVHCNECIYYDRNDGYCRCEDFVHPKKENGQTVWKVTNVTRFMDDYCSRGEYGEYEPWGFEDDI